MISIKRFGGQITNPQSEDIPNEAAVWARDTDPNYKGKLIGIPVNGAAYQANGNVEIPDVYEAAWIKYEVSGASKWDLVYADKEDDDITVVENFYAVEGSRTFNDLVTAPLAEPQCVKAFNNTAQIGSGNGDGELPYVVYRLINDRKFFNDNKTVSAGVFAHYGKCDNQDINFTVNQVTQTTPLQVNFTQIFGGGVVNHRMVKGDRIEIRGVVGATGANGIFTVSVLSDTVITLDGTSSGGAYVSGGTCFGSWCYIFSETYNAAAGYFQADTLYAYGISVVYDGLQESNLLTTFDSNLSSVSNAAAGDTITLVLHVSAAFAANSMFEDSLFDKRVTAVKIYRAECSAGDENPENLGLYRLVQTIDTNKGQGEVNWSSVGVFSYVDNGGYPGGGAIYEEETGIEGILERTYIHYGMNEVGGGYHWMAKPYIHPQTAAGVPTPIDWDRYIFRSQKFRPNMVNWKSGNHVVLEEIPTAMAWYNNKLYAFSENNLYRINPELLIVEDTFEGRGCSNRHAVTVTEFGMFFCNKNGAYRLLGNQVDVLSDDIKIDGSPVPNIGWDSFSYDALTDPATLGRIIVLYEANMRAVIFIGNNPNGDIDSPHTLSFHLPTQSWREWTLSTNLTAVDTNSGAFTGKDGEVYFSDGTNLIQLMGGATTTAFDWVSKEFDNGRPSQNDSWTKLIWDSSGTVVVKYNTNGGNPTSGTTATSGAYINIYKKTFQLYIDGSAAATMDSMDILVRGLIGER